MPQLAKALDGLRTELLRIKPAGPDGFEGLVAECLADLSGLVFRLAKSGSQFGRDASSPPAPFAIAMEAKRYRDSLSLEEVAGKAIVGGQVLSGDVDLWVLGVTSEVGDAVVAKLTTILEEYGVTLLTLDWAGQPLPPLAVLLAATKVATVSWFERYQQSVDTDRLATQLDAVVSHRAFASQAKELRDRVSAADVGLDALRRRSTEWLRQRFVDRELSQISFGQFVTVSDTALPSQPRTQLARVLADAAGSTFATGGVLAILGEEGVGKTWLLARWWTALPSQPILLFVAGRRSRHLVPDDPIERPHPPVGGAG